MESIAPIAPTCRHEYVLIFQRRLKGLDRRLVATRAWLPVGFKPADLSHLGEGSYCFCSKCRTRLFPKRTNAEKAQARAALAAEKAQARLAGPDNIDSVEQDVAETIDETVVQNIHVEELVIEAVELEDLEEGSVNLSEAESSCNMAED